MLGFGLKPASVLQLRPVRILLVPTNQRYWYPSACGFGLPQDFGALAHALASDYGTFVARTKLRD